MIIIYLTNYNYIVIINIKDDSEPCVRRYKITYYYYYKLSSNTNLGHLRSLVIDTLEFIHPHFGYPLKILFFVRAVFQFIGSTLPKNMARVRAG